MDAGPHATPVKRTSRFENILRRAGGELQPGEELLRYEVLGPVLAAGLGLGVLYLIVGFFADVRSHVFPWDAIELAVVAAIGFVLRARGHTALAAMLLIVVLSHPIAFLCATYGLASPAPALFVPTIALAGLIVGHRLVALWTVICIAVCAFVTASRFSPPLDAVWSGVFVATAGIVVQLCRRLEALLTLARDQEEAARDAVLSERTRMARDLHDSLAQGFTGVVVQLRAAEQAASTEPDRLAGHLERAREAALEGLRTAKASVWALRDFGSDDLESTLRNLVANRLQPAGISYAVNCDNLPDLGSELRKAVLAIAGEALTNILRHSGATECRLELRRDARRVAFTIADNGSGVSDGPGLGVAGMKERAAAVGGSVTLSPNKPSGTVVRFDWAIEDLDG